MGGPLPHESNINMTGAGLVGKSTSGAGKSGRMSQSSVLSWLGLSASGVTDGKALIASSDSIAWSPSAAALLPDTLPVVGTLLSYGGSRQLAAGGNVSHAGDITLTGGANGIYISPSGVNKGLIYFSAGQNRLYGQPTVPWVVESDAGFKVRNSANSADAAITAGAITANGAVNFQNGSGVTYAGWTGSGRIFYAGGDAFAVRTSTGGTYLFNAGFLAVTNSTDASSATADTYLSRESAGVWRMGTTSTGSGAGLKCGAITASGDIIAATKILFSGTHGTDSGIINALGTRLIWGRNSTSAALITQSLSENAGGSGFTFRRGEGLSWSGSTTSSEAGGQTAYFFSEAANTYNFRNGLSAQSLEVENTYTSSNTREFIRLRGVAGGNFEFGPSNGTVGGTLRGLTIGGYVNGSSTITPWLKFDNAGMTTVYGTTPTFRVFHSSDSLGAILSLSGFSSMLSAYRDVGGANLYLRSSTGGTDKVATLSAGGLCVRNYADSADAALTAGAITASGAVMETPTQSSIDPTAVNIPSGQRRGWYNSTLAEFRDWVNIGGTLLKSAAYT